MDEKQRKLTEEWMCDLESGEFKPILHYLVRVILMSGREPEIGTPRHGEVHPNERCCLGVVIHTAARLGYESAIAAEKQLSEDGFFWSGEQKKMTSYLTSELWAELFPQINTDRFSMENLAAVNDQQCKDDYGPVLEIIKQELNNG